jgi:hypothetical protein
MLLTILYLLVTTTTICGQPMLDELARYFAAVPPDSRHAISVLVPGERSPTTMQARANGITRRFRMAAPYHGLRCCRGPSNRSRAQQPTAHSPYDRLVRVVEAADSD